MTPTTGEEPTATPAAPRAGRMWRRRRLAVLAFVAIAPLVIACGSDDPGPEAEPEESDQSDENAEVSTPDTADTDDTDISDGGTGDASTDSLDLFANGVATALEADSYEITGQTSVRFVFSEGTSDASHGIECTAAGVVLPEDTEITLAYPDGEWVCE